MILNGIKLHEFQRLIEIKLCSECRRTLESGGDAECRNYRGYGNCIREESK